MNFLKNTKHETLFNHVRYENNSIEFNTQYQIKIYNTFQLLNNILLFVSQSKFDIALFVRKSTLESLLIQFSIYQFLKYRFHHTNNSWDNQFFLYKSLNNRYVFSCFFDRHNDHLIIVHIRHFFLNLCILQSHERFE